MAARDYRLCWKRARPAIGKWHDNGSRPGIEAFVYISAVVDYIRSENDEIRTCAGHAKLAKARKTNWAHLVWYST
jgi:hypothetical protein